MVERRDTNRLNWVIMHAECKELTCNITGLFKNTEYLFRVRGVNKYGEGVNLQSEPMVARNTFSKCSSQIIANDIPKISEAIKILHFYFLNNNLTKMKARRIWLRAPRVNLVANY